MSKYWPWALVLLCALSLFVSVFFMIAPPASTPEPASGTYLLKDWGGHLALFRANDASPLEIYPLYTHLLPPADVESLRNGIPLRNMEQVEQLLEDFGA